MEIWGNAAVIKINYYLFAASFAVILPAQAQTACEQHEYLYYRDTASKTSVSRKFLVMDYCRYETRKRKYKEDNNEAAAEICKVEQTKIFDVLMASPAQDSLEAIQQAVSCRDAAPTPPK